MWLACACGARRAWWCQLECQRALARAAVASFSLASVSLRCNLAFVCLAGPKGCPGVATGSTALAERSSIIRGVDSSMLSEQCCLAPELLAGQCELGLSHSCVHRAVTMRFDCVRFSQFVWSAMTLNYEYMLP
eukprot:53930-Amphidinium_carterae.1